MSVSSIGGYAPNYSARAANQSQTRFQSSRTAGSSQSVKFGLEPVTCTAVCCGIPCGLPILALVLGIIWTRLRR